jgi:hypothetical protein
VIAQTVRLANRAELCFPEIQRINPLLLCSIPVEGLQYRLCALSTDLDGPGILTRPINCKPVVAGLGLGNGLATNKSESNC